eukprot:COSAG04_NODE_411_length_14759_cov_28.639520_5_plen_200_part_00
MHSKAPHSQQEGRQIMLGLLLLAGAGQSGSGPAPVSYVCHNATDQPAAPNLRLLMNLTTSRACEERCSADPHCVAYVVADCTAGSHWLGQCGGAKPCDVPKGRLDCWLKSGTTPAQPSGCRQICTNGRAPAPAPPRPAPGPAPSYTCTRAGACVPGVGHVSYTDPSCFHQCAPGTEAAAAEHTEPRPVRQPARVQDCGK